MFQHTEVGDGVMLICLNCNHAINKTGGTETKQYLQFRHDCQGKQICTSVRMLRNGELTKAGVKINPDYTGTSIFPWQDKVMKLSRKRSSSNGCPEDQPPSSRGNLTKLFSNKNLS